MLHSVWRPIQWCLTCGFQHLKGSKVICASLFFFIALAAINGILNSTPQSLSALLIMNWHLLVQNHLHGKVCDARGLLCFDVSLL